MTHRLRLRDLLSLPLFILLHVLFTVSSLALRLYESLSQPSPRARPPRNQARRPPRHVALVLSHPPPLPPRGRSLDIKRFTEERKALIESVRRAVQWAGEEGVVEMSVYDGQGLLELCRSTLVQSLLRLPPSPPPSGSSSPPRASSSPRDVKDEIESVTTLIVFPSYSTESESQPMTVHLLPPSSSGPLLARLARRYATADTPQHEITQKRLDAEFREALHFTTDPDLLLIHTVSPPPLYRALLPRPPAELGGYPFWVLSITEIYQHPTPLPLPSTLIALLRPPLDRARESRLPLVRKLARLLPVGGEEGDEAEIRGALRREEWEGAMEAWSRVEQRLGR